MRSEAEQEVMDDWRRTYIRWWGIAPEEDPYFDRDEMLGILPCGHPSTRVTYNGRCLHCIKHGRSKKPQPTTADHMPCGHSYRALKRRSEGCYTCDRLASRRGYRRAKVATGRSPRTGEGWLDIEPLRAWLAGRSLVGLTDNQRRWVRSVREGNQRQVHENTVDRYLIALGGMLSDVYPEL